MSIWNGGLFYERVKIISSVSEHATRHVRPLYTQTRLTQNTPHFWSSSERDRIEDWYARDMKWPSNHTLIGISGLFGGFVGCTGLYMHSLLQTRFKQTTFVRESLRTLNENKSAKYLLGKLKLFKIFYSIYSLMIGTPIRDFDIKFNDTENNYKTESEAVNLIPVKGPKGHGYYFIRAEPRGEGGRWVGVRMELEIEKTSMLEEEKYKDKRLVVFDCDRNGPLLLTADWDRTCLTLSQLCVSVSSEC